MKTITITPNDPILQVEYGGEFTDDEALTVLIQAYLCEAQETIDNHKCFDPRCRLVQLHRSIVNDIQRIYELYVEEQKAPEPIK